MTGTAMQIIQWLTRQKPEVRFDIKQHREKRSLDANGYYWKLVTEMADNLRMAKPEVHNIMLRRYGQAEGVDGRLVTVYIPDTEKAERQALMAEDYHIKPTAYVEEGSKGQLFRQYILLRGSRTYDSREMAILIEGTRRECEQLGIQTMTPAELERYGVEKHNSEA